MYERKKVVRWRRTYGESISKISNNNVVIFGDSITNFSRYHKNIFNQKNKDRGASFKYFPGALSRGILHYVNSTLEESELDVAIIYVRITPKLRRWYTVPSLIYPHLG